VRGYIDLDEEDMTQSSAHVVADLKTIDTNDSARDDHLRSPDFFDVEKYPEMTFDTTQIDVMDAQHLQVIGNLTLHGVTREVTLATTYGGQVKDPWGNQRIGFEATGTINREDFGLTWNAALEAGGVLVGDEVNINIECEAVLTAPEAATSGTSSGSASIG
jgi:polyisoprenoid-binding protein YceI